jgi:AcrR family transcriptional regulator
VPRIAAPTIEAHVAQQEEAVVRAATRLFTERGFHAVTLADIAAAAGLKRTSLYRYFPDKDHILLAWLRRAVEPLLVRSTEIAAGPGTPPERVRAWLRLQLDELTDPDHRLFTAIAQTAGALSDDVQAEIGVQHRLLYDTIGSSIAEALAGTRRDPVLVTGLLLGLLRATADAIGHGVDRSAAVAELDAAASTLLRRR